MDKKHQVTLPLLVWVAPSILIIVCYFFIDKLVAIWLFHESFRTLKIVKYFSQIPEVFLAMALIIYLMVSINFIKGRLSYFEQRSLIFANGIAITQFLKDFFKFIFGRYWPETWINNNPSLITNNEYGFNFFHWGINYGAFPSGHAATLTAGLTLLWLLSPRFKYLYIGLAIISIIGILGMNFHFVSDIIAGGLLGYLVAFFTYYLSVSKTKMLD